jgi:hypothetical protein
MEGIRHMEPKASLKSVADELELLTAQRHAYLNKKTGQTVSISEEEIEMVDGETLPDSIPAWERELVDLARDILQSEVYLELPTTFDIHDYAIMEHFCQDQEDQELRVTLLNLIRGPGAFGRFKKAIDEFDIAPAWYQFRRAACREIAIDWLDTHEIPYVDDDK